MNIIFSGYAHPFLGIISSILIILGTEKIGNLLLIKFKNFFFLNFISGFIIICFFFNLAINIGITFLFLKIISIILLLLGLSKILNFIKLINTLNIKKNINFENIILFIIFIISASAPTMADALDYHLGVPLFLNKFGFMPDKHMWIHGNLAGYGELYNSIGLYINNDVLGGICQSIGLISFLYFFKEEINNKKKFKIFFYFIIGSPILLFLISGPKFQLLPQLMTTYTLYLILINNTFSYYKIFIILFLLFGAINIKLTFIISSSILLIYLLYKIDKSKKKKIIIIYIFYFILILLFKTNLSNLSNFLNVEDITNLPKEFIQRVVNYRENSYYFPFNLFIPDSPGKISSLIGYQILIFLLFKNYKYEKIVFILITVVAIIFHFKVSSISRFYYELILWLSLIIVSKEISNTQYKKMLSILLINSTIFISLIAFSIQSLGPSILSNKFRTEVMEKKAYEFNAFNWLNSNINKDKTVITDLRSNALANFNFIPMDYLNYDIEESNLKNYKNFLRQSNIDFIALRNFTSFSKIFKNCQFTEVSKSPNFIEERRNPFNNQPFYNVTIYKFINTKDCLK